MRSVCFILLAVLLFSLSACEPSHQQQKQASAAKDEKKDIIPLSAEKADGAEGWLNNSTILYTASNPTKTELFAYRIFTGKAKKLYQTDGQIVDVQINAREQMILLQITHSQKTAVVLLNAEGETLYEKDYETYELEAAWNQYDPYQMMVTEFNENWDFHTYQVNAKKDESFLSPVQVPFIHWTSKNTFDYVKEGRDDKTGPLYTFDTASKTEQKLEDDVLFFDSFHQMSVTVKSASGGKGTYQLKRRNQHHLLQRNGRSKRNIQVWHQWSMTMMKQEACFIHSNKAAMHIARSSQCSIGRDKRSCVSAGNGADSNISEREICVIRLSF